MPKLVFKLSDSQLLDFPLPGEQVRLGRNEANDIVIDNSWISSFHAEFRLTPDGVMELRDLNSRNGTTVNGTRIERVLLKPGDSVVFGQLEAIFDPLPEGSKPVNGTIARALSPPPDAVVPAALSGPRVVSPAAAGDREMKAVTPQSRPVATEPVPSAHFGSRLAVAAPAPVAVPATAPVSLDAGAEFNGGRQQGRPEPIGLHNEIKLLQEKVEALRRDRESEEQDQAQRRLQGEREARELRLRLEGLQSEIDKNEAAAAKAAAAGASEAQKLEELQRTVRHLEERKQTFMEAPDLNWGTVHAMSKGLIKQIDLLDDLISHLVAHKGPRESIEHMQILRAGLMDILTEYSIEPYRFEPGFLVDLSARKKIQIVESQADSGSGTRIERTFRPGYICRNGPVGVQTLLRKAEVSILLGR